jgi:capsular polysaccharide biosynthesis protein
VPIANAISDELIQNGPTYFPQMYGIGTIARQVDEPNPIALPPSLKAQLLGPALRVILAAGVGLGLVFLAHYLDPMAREFTEVEALGIPIIASIPKPRKRSNA